MLERRGLKPEFQRAKPRGRPMPRHIARGNARRARIRSRVEHVFAAQKRRFDLVIRTIGKARATAKLALANLAYNFTRLAWIESRVGVWRRRPSPQGAAHSAQSGSNKARTPLAAAAVEPRRQQSASDPITMGSSSRPIACLCLMKESVH